MTLTVETLAAMLQKADSIVANRADAVSCVASKYWEKFAEGLLPQLGAGDGTTLYSGPYMTPPDEERYDDFVLVHKRNLSPLDREAVEILAEDSRMRRAAKARLGAGAPEGTVGDQPCAEGEPT